MSAGVVLLNAMATRAGGAVTRVGEIARRAPAMWQRPVLIARARSVDFGPLDPGAQVLLPPRLDRLPAPLRRQFEQPLLQRAIATRGVRSIVHFGSFVPLRRTPGVVQLLAFTNLGPWQPGRGARSIRNRILRRLFETTIDRADFVTAESDASVDMLLRLRPSLEGRIAALKNGVAIPPLGPPAGLSGFVVVGDILPHRRLAEVVRAYGALPEAVRTAHPLEVIGHVRDVAEVAAVRAAAEAAAVTEQVRLVGPKSRLEVLRRVASAQAFVSWSSVENGPNAVLEAAALGAPMVLSDLPAHREYGGSGARYAQDVAGLTAALEAAAAASVSPRRSIGPIDTWDEHVQRLGHYLEELGAFRPNAS